LRTIRGEEGSLTLKEGERSKPRLFNLSSTFKVGGVLTSGAKQEKGTNGKGRLQSVQAKDRKGVNGSSRRGREDGELAGISQSCLRTH